MRFGQFGVSKKNDDDESSKLLLIQNLDKSTVVQDVKIFHETNINSHACISVITRLIFAIGQGAVLNENEATDTFFALTKLFQFKNPILRRLCHIAIKSLSGMAKDILIATSSLSRDATGNDQFIRASAIRALCAITDVSLLPGIERYLKQAIVDKNQNVSTSALVSSIRFADINPDFIKRWLNEIIEIANNDGSICQYHALGLFYIIKQYDKLAISKTIQKNLRSSGKSIPSSIFLIRMAAYNLVDNMQSPDSQNLLDFIENCLHNRNEAVVYEACRAFIFIPGVSIKYLSQTISVMRVFLTSPRTIVRYGAVYTLSYMSSIYPNLISECAIDLESILTDSNKSLATYAVTTLLKVGTESNVERIIKIVSSFISEITETFRIVIVQELKFLAVKYPKKAQIFLNFVSSIIREEGGIEFKRNLVDLVTTIIHHNHEVREIGLLLLCEFIEDCEHHQLSITVMHLLSIEGPSANNPSQYIRYIYNRIMLESCEIRAAAVTCLAKFGSRCSYMRPSVLQLLQRCFSDRDDEVRDRAAFYYTLLKRNDSSLNHALIDTSLHISPIDWYNALKTYISAGETSKSFTVEQVAEYRKTVPSSLKTPEKKIAEPLITVSEPKLDSTPLAVLQTLLGLSSSDGYSHTSYPYTLTDSDAEFNIKYVKHMFNSIVVFEFLIFNTLPDYNLESVDFSMSLPPPFTFLKSHQCNLIAPNSSGCAFLAIKLPSDPTHIVESFPTSMTYRLVEGDLNAISSSSKDEYKIDNVELNFCDHIKSTSAYDFDEKWDLIPDENESEDTFALGISSNLQETIDDIIKITGLSPCKNSQLVKNDARSHTLFLSGIYRTGVDILAKLSLKYTPSNILLKLILKCEDPNVGENLFSVIS